MQVLWSFWSGFSESKWCDYFLLTNTNTKLLKEEGKKKEKKKNQNKACTQKSRAALPSQFKTKPWNLSEGRRVGEKQIPNIEDCKAVLVLAGGVHFPSTNTALKACFPQYEEDLLWVFICNIEKAQNTAQQVLSIMPARRDHHPSAASKAQGITAAQDVQLVGTDTFHWRRSWRKGSQIQKRRNTSQSYLFLFHLYSETLRRNLPISQYCRGWLDVSSVLCQEYQQPWP